MDFIGGLPRDKHDCVVRLNQAIEILDADGVLPKNVQRGLLAEALFVMGVDAENTLDAQARMLFNSDPDTYRVNKIQMIKELRRLTNCGLKEAKEACGKVWRANGL